MRKVFIGGNWKSNGSLKFINTHFERVLNKVTFDPSKCEVVVAPMNIHLQAALNANKNPNVHVAAQNVSLYKDGAFTGEVSAAAIKDLGLRWVIIGHSERRQLYGESSEVVANKNKMVEEQGLNSIACIGETLQEREANRTLKVVFEQLSAIRNGKPDWSKIVIAYEPVWAIGTGKTASPEQAQEVHGEIRNWLSKEVSKDVSSSTRIIYGGSVNAQTAPTLIQKPDIDGFLVGGAALKPEFNDIISAYSNKKF